MAFVGTGAQRVPIRIMPVEICCCHRLGNTPPKCPHLLTNPLPAFTVKGKTPQDIQVESWREKLFLHFVFSSCQLPAGSWIQREEQDALVPVSWLCLAQSDVTLDFKLPVIHTFQKRFPVDVPAGEREAERSRVSTDLPWRDARLGACNVECCLD